MAAVLPAAAFLAIFYLTNCFWVKLDRRLQMGRTAILWGIYLMLGTEVLSLFGWVTLWGLIVWWTIPIVVALAWWGHHQPRKMFRPQWTTWKASWQEILLLAGIVFVLAVTVLVAWKAPPSTWDSLGYHMPRVARWAQDGRVHHYATGITAQNSAMPGAEIIILNFYVLAQGDRLANFVEWFSMLGSVILASLAAKYLGANRLGQILAGVVTVSIPMGIVQASSTMTDYVAAFWVLCVAVEIFHMRTLPDSGKLDGFQMAAFSALAAGLAMLTKPIAVPYLMPLAVYEGWLLLRRFSWKKLLAWGLLAILLFALPNLGHWGRNLHAFGNPFSEGGYGQAFANELFTPQVIASNLIRNIAQHTGLPWGRVNKWIYETVVAIHEKLLKLDVEDPRTTTVGPYPWMSIKTHEDLAGNALHAFLALFSFGAVLISRRRLGNTALIWASIAAFGFVLFSVIFKWQIFGTRYHMPFFVLMSPLIAYVFSRLLPSWGVVLGGLLLIVAASPWLFSINSRPIIPNEHATVGSILKEDRLTLYFANGPYLNRLYEDITNTIKDAHCNDVALSLGGGQAEYPIWVMLGAPFNGRRVIWYVSTGANYPNDEIEPCAVICQDCQADTYDGMPLVYRDDLFALYLQR